MYKAKVKTPENHQINYGTLDGEFKIWFNNLNCSRIEDILIKQNCQNVSGSWMRIIKTLI